tara:strand:+ start:39633 stop:40535 length:903 start_codon:yes stop_codon:yes gene_type:complete
MEGVDVAIIGGGFGGLASALWCHRLGLRCVVLERREALGGQLHWIYNPLPDYPGFTGDGAALAAQLTSQLHSLSIPVHTNVEVHSIEDEPLRLRTSAGELTARACILATGLRRRRLRVPGAETFEGKGLSYTASGCPEMFEGKHVAIVGGGDGAFENALILAKTSPHVTILYRGDAPRARPQFTEEVDNSENITLLCQHDVLSIQGDACVESVLCEGPEGQKELAIGALLVKIGLEPNIQLVESLCALDDTSTVQTDRLQRTTHERIFAVGDVCTSLDPSLSVAAGQACFAVREIERLLR